MRGMSLSETLKQYSCDPRLNIIGIDGGPGGGKTTFMARGRQYFEDRGFRVGIRPELATELITSGFPPWADWKDPLDFQRFVLEESIARDITRCRMMLRQDTVAPLLLFCDRPSFNGIAYVTEHEFALLLRECGVRLPELLDFYKGGIHLVTAAYGAEEFYNTTPEGRAVRHETIEQARARDQKTYASWRGHQHHFRIDNSTGFDAKILRAINRIARILGVPEGYEIERKFLVRKFSRELLPEHVVVVEIEQTYLLEHRPHHERRVRKRELDGHITYYYTEKVLTDDPGARKEFERQITQADYETLLLERDATLHPIRKTRHCVQHGGHMLEIDVFRSPVPFVMMEIEVETLLTPIDLPANLEIAEVTGNENYYGKNVARGSLRPYPNS